MLVFVNVVVFRCLCLRVCVRACLSLRVLACVLVFMFDYLRLSVLCVWVFVCVGLSVFVFVCM